MTLTASKINEEVGLHVYGLQTGDPKKILAKTLCENCQGVPCCLMSLHLLAKMYNQFNYFFFKK